jgi:hypothetical protein
MGRKPMAKPVITNGTSPSQGHHLGRRGCNCETATRSWWRTRENGVVAHQGKPGGLLETPRKTPLGVGVALKLDLGPGTKHAPPPTNHPVLCIAVISPVYMTGRTRQGPLGI